jgi:hypothetical protein
LLVSTPNTDIRGHKAAAALSAGKKETASLFPAALTIVREFVTLLSAMIDLLNCKQATKTIAQTQFSTARFIGHRKYLAL